MQMLSSVISVTSFYNFEGRVYLYNDLERGSVKRNLAHSFCQFALNWRSMSKPPLFDTI